MSRKVRQLRLPFDSDPPPKLAALLKPIVVPLQLDDPLVGLPEQLEKLELLKEYYRLNNWPALALKLAQDFHPGFKVVFDDPLAREKKCGIASGKEQRRK
jgi:hypothetical protein